MKKAKPRVLLFCRPYLVPDYQAAFEPLASRYELVVLTDGRRKDTHNTCDRFYRFMAEREPQPSLLSAEEVNDCVARCRLLRNLPRPEAEKRLHAMAATLREWLDELKPDLVVSHLVDDYVTHLMCLLCRKRELPYFAYTGSFFPGLVQVYLDERGTPLLTRAADDQEIDDLIATITKRAFRQNYNNPGTYSPLVHLYRVARYRVKRIVFWAKGVMQRDPLQTHYAITPYLAERQRLRDYPPAKLFAADWRQTLRAAPPSRPVIYIVLGYFPEATIDYWVQNKALLDFDEKMQQIAAALARRFTVVVKEHPHMMGIRKPTLYRRLGAIEGVILVPPLEYSAEVMQQCKAVVIGGGSGGVEAVLKDLPIFSYCDTSYWYLPSGATYLDLDHVADWPDVIAAGMADFHPRTAEQKREFIRACLASTLRMRDAGRVWPLPVVDDAEHALEQMLS